MADKLTMRQLKTELDELRSKVDGLSPTIPDEDGNVIVSGPTLEEFTEVRAGIASLQESIDRLILRDNEQRASIKELAQAANTDMDTLSRDIGSLNVSKEEQDRIISELRDRIDTLSRELEEALATVDGLRASAKTDMTEAERKEAELKEMQTRMNDVFKRMSRVENYHEGVVKQMEERDTKFNSFQRESRNERTLIAVLASAALGVTLVVLALALAGMI